jgi:hypothetical protein
MRRCASDGCIGGVVPAMLMFAALTTQFVLFLPVYVVVRRRRKLPVLVPTLAWAVVSGLAFYLPGLLIHR